jgi:[acyl-carrier-protein] S-malonyltransferase
VKAVGKSAWVFPGQGSQHVGMGRDLVEAYPQAAATFGEADAALGFDLTSICISGPEEKLRQTRYTQLAILTHSVAVARVLEARAPRPAWVAGHSVGEYSALVAAGALTFADALGLVKVRAEAMYAAGLARPGAMAAVLGMPEDRVEDLLAEARAAGTIEAANYNSPAQIVVSGEAAAVDAAVKAAPAFGAKRAMRLNVSGAFHSPLMAGAEQDLARALEQVRVSRPGIPVVFNVTAGPASEPGEIADLLRRQITSPVLWRQSVGFMLGQGVDCLVEAGPGNVLCGLARRIAPEVKCFQCSDPGTIGAYLREVEA